MSKLHEWCELFDAGVKPGDTLEFFSPSGRKSRGRCTIKSIDRKPSGEKTMTPDPWPIGVKNGDSFRILPSAPRTGETGRQGS